MLQLFKHRDACAICPVQVNPEVLAPKCLGPIIHFHSDSKLVMKNRSNPQNRLIGGYTDSIIDLKSILRSLKIPVLCEYLT